jgi:hypothetical protein
MTRHGWQSVPGERSVRSSQVWFRLLDDFTSRAPIEQVTVRLDRQDGAGWTPLDDVRATITTTGMVAFPGLDRRRPVVGLPPRRFRVRIDSEHYRPLYRQQASGVEFQTTPVDVDDPAPLPVLRQDLVLLPSVTYPYPAHVYTVRGEVRTQAGAPVEDVVVRNQVQIGAAIRTELTLTDDRGAFVLALRFVAAGQTAQVTATDRRTLRTGTVNVAVPGDLRRSQLVTII